MIDLPGPIPNFALDGSTLTGVVPLLLPPEDGTLEPAGILVSFSAFKKSVKPPGLVGAPGPGVKFVVTLDLGAEVDAGVTGVGFNFSCF